jgi:hypothetical protein
MTKYITIRIPVPTLSWFTKKEEEEFSDTYSDLPNRIAEIQSRISVAKRSIERIERSNKAASSQPKLTVDTDTKTEQPRAIDDDRDRKAVEMNDLKTKLLGKKK